MRLIDADELFNELNKLDLDYGAMGGVAECLDRIEEAPTIEPTDNEINEAYFQGYKKGKSDERQFAERHTKAEPSDLVSRQDVIDRLNELHREVEEVWDDDYDRGTMHGLAWATDILKGLPSADTMSIEEHQQIVTELKQSYPSGDLVSREDAIEVGNKIIEELSLSSVDWDNLKYWAKELFDALPSADRPQGEDWDKYSEKLWQSAYERGKNDRPKGEWKKRLGAYWCSECNRPTVDKTPFCSECGADMRTK